MLKALVALGLLAAVILFFAAPLIDFLTIIAIAALVIATAFAGFIRIVRPYTGEIVAFLGKPVRSFGPGTHFMFKLFGLEQIYEIVDIRKETKTVAAPDQLELPGEEIVQGQWSFVYSPDPGNLIRNRRFLSEVIEKDLLRRIKAAGAAISQRYRGDDPRTQFMDDRNFANDIRTAVLAETEDGLPLAVYCGIVLNAVKFVPDIPKELAQAAIEKEAADKRIEIEKKQASHRNDLAKKRMQSAQETGSPITFQEAADGIHLQFKELQKTITQVGLDRGTLAVAEKVVLEGIRQLQSKPSSGRSQPPRTPAKKPDFKLTAEATKEALDRIVGHRIEAAVKEVKNDK
jgi:hypothetical protein